MANAALPPTPTDLTPVFDIPRLDGVTIDGKPDDGGDQGFGVELMAGPDGTLKPASDLDARFRLAWDERGLLVLLTVHDDTSIEDDQLGTLWQRDCVELYMADQRGGQQLQPLLQYFATNWRRQGGERIDGAATIFAWLLETPPGQTTSVRNDPWTRASAWMHELKRRTGHLMPLNYVAHMPPGATAGQAWTAPALDDLLAEVVAKYPVDPERVYLTGLSMGGIGSWMYAVARPDRFAAVVPICGMGDPDDLDVLKELPVWVFHGAKDPSVPVARGTEMAERLRQLGGRVRLTAYPDAGHDSWTATYANPELYDWLLQQRRGKPQEPPVKP